MLVLLTGHVCHTCTKLYYWRLIDIYGVLCSLSQTTKMLLQQLVWPQKCTNVSVRPDNTGIAFLHYFWDLQVKVRSVPLSDFGIKVQTSISAMNTRLCDIRNIVIALPGNPLTLKSLIQPRCLKSPFNGYGVGLVGEGCYPPHPSWFLHKFELLAFLYISIDCSFIIDIHAEEVLWIQR